MTTPADFTTQPVRNQPGVIRRGKSFFRVLPDGRRIRIANPDQAKGLADRGEIVREGKAQSEQRRRILDEQTGVQRTRLEDLTQLLASEENRKFNLAIPDIANTAQAQGFLETSGFAQALANRRVGFAGDTAAELAKQSLRDRDLEIRGIGEAGQIERNFGGAGLGRQFSVEDRAKADELARELAQFGVVSQPGQSSTDRNLDRASQVVGIGAGVAQISQGTYLCTKLKNMGFITESEVKKVHNKVFPAMRKHPADWLMYNLIAPIFIKVNQDMDWESLKPLLCDDVLKCKDSEEAFQKYKEVCMSLFSNTSPILAEVR